MKTPENVRIAIAINLAWPFKRHLEIFDGVNRYAVNAGWETVVFPLPQLATSRRRTWPFDGVVGRLGDTVERRLAKAGVPAVNVWLNSPATGIPSVFPDWEAIGRIAAEHLLGRGFRRFAFFGVRQDRGVELQCNAFRSALQSAGCDCDCHLFDPRYADSLSQWDKFTNRLSRIIQSLDAPVGIGASNDLLGRFTLDACLSEGLQVPHDAAVLSADNEHLLCENSSPSLSSIDPGYQQIGWLAAELLNKLMRNEKVPSSKIVHQPQELVLRQSTDAFAVDDPQVAAALRFIASQSHRPITVDDVANHVATSRRTLERRFQDCLHRTISAETTRMRVERTKRQLLKSDEPLKMIALRNGFRDSSHLCTVFRRELGISPGEYRDDHKSG